MGSNGTPKKRGLYHHLYKQWKETKIGREAHEADVKRQRDLPVKAKQMK